VGVPFFRAQIHRKYRRVAEDTLEWYEETTALLIPYLGLWVNVDPSIKPGKWVNVDHNPEKVGEIIGRLQCILCILLQYYSSMP